MLYPDQAPAATPIKSQQPDNCNAISEEDRAWGFVQELLPLSYKSRLEQWAEWVDKTGYRSLDFYKSSSKRLSEEERYGLRASLNSLADRALKGDPGLPVEEAIGHIARYYAGQKYLLLLDKIYEPTLRQIRPEGLKLLKRDTLKATAGLAVNKAYKTDSDINYRNFEMAVAEAMAAPELFTHSKPAYHHRGYETDLNWLTAFAAAQGFKPKLSGRRLEVLMLILYWAREMNPIRFSQLRAVEFLPVKKGKISPGNVNKYLWEAEGFLFTFLKKPESRGQRSEYGILEICPEFMEHRAKHPDHTVLTSDRDLWERTVAPPLPPILPLPTWDEVLRSFDIGEKVIEQGRRVLVSVVRPLEQRGVAINVFNERNREAWPDEWAKWMRQWELLREAGLGGKAVDQVTPRMLIEAQKRIAGHHLVEYYQIEYLKAQQERSGRVGLDAPISFEAVGLVFPVMRERLEQVYRVQVASTDIFPYVDRKGRVYSEYRVASPSCHRITARRRAGKVNLQNVPKELLQLLLNAPEGCVLADVDFKNKELRILAELSGDENLIELCNTSADAYGEMARRFLPECGREAMKQFVLSFIYGSSRHELLKKLRAHRVSINDEPISLEKVIEIEKQIKAAFKIADHRLDDFAASGKIGIGLAGSDSRVQRSQPTPFGFVRDLTHLSKPDRRGKITRNTPIQGAAAELFKESLCQLTTLCELGEKIEWGMAVPMHDGFPFWVRGGQEMEFKRRFEKAVELAREIVFEGRSRVSYPLNWDWWESEEGYGEETPLYALAPEQSAQAGVEVIEEVCYDLSALQELDEEDTGSLEADEFNDPFAGGPESLLKQGEWARRYTDGSGVRVLETNSLAYLDDEDEWEDSLTGGSGLDQSNYRSRRERVDKILERTRQVYGRRGDGL